MPLNSVILTVITNRFLFCYVIGAILIIVVIIIRIKGKACAYYIVGDLPSLTP